ncbi:transposase [Thiohalobacter sp. IOR34]|uniref:REP-associated tyrosine transposase n=1 Tax=Thiohalobacter sp. IOR34 TaxID=3057176 RepID=UPI0025B1BD68|nr:transposase [Thiohalobacter sp. IOR34]WJW75450.1 transposase [Thiohalobacter sp. IOR34]
MARPLRLEFAGALYHVTARGDRREDIYLDDEDRRDFLVLLGEVCNRYNWLVHAYCLMSNHYHLLVETPDGNLSRGMRQLNGVYTQRFNRRHGRVGHVYQGRYKGILVQKGTYLLELARYVVLNPVRAGMVAEAGQWPWSSFRASIGEESAPAWLETDWLLAQFGETRGKAVRRYIRFVREGVGASSPWGRLRYQVFFGDEEFVERFRDPRRFERLSEVPKAQRRPLARTLAEYRNEFPRAEAMARAYLSGAYTMKAIGEFFGVHYMTVSRAVRRFEAPE